MKSYKLWIFLSIVFMVQNCKKNDECSPDSEQFILQKDKKIERSIRLALGGPIYTYEIESGENLVMEYIFDQAQCDPIQDDEYGYRLAFELDKEIENFSLENNELESLKAHFQEFGAWVDHKQRPILKGKISGQKRSDNSWAIQIDITTDSVSHTGSKHLVVDEIFRE